MEEFEEFEEDDEFEDDEFEEPQQPLEPVRRSKPLELPVPTRERQPQPQLPRKSNGQFEKKGAVEEPREIVREKVKEQPKVEPKAQEPQITAEELILALQNHEQRIITLESALFRLRGAI